MAEIQRGGFARDKRTGAYVKVAEKGGRDWMVKPAYKSDGYWASPADLVPARDPHEWGAAQFIAFLIALMGGAVSAYLAYRDMTGQGLGTGDAVWYSTTHGMIAVWIIRVLSRNIRP